MGRIFNTDKLFIYENNRGEQLELLNVTNHRENYSACPMHMIIEKDGNLETKAVLADTIRPALSKFTISEQIIFFRIVNKLLTNSTPYHLLYISNKSNKFMEYVAAILKFFNKESKMYWLTESTEIYNDKRITTLRMPYEDLLLPNDYFDIIIVNSLDELPVWLDAIKDIILSSKKNGLLLNISSNNEIVNTVSTIFNNSILYADDMNIKIQEVNDIVDVINDLRQETDSYIHGRYKEIISEVINNIGNELQGNIINIDDILAVAVELEKYINQIHPYLLDRNYKYKFNCFKETMINYKLGICDLDDVRNKFDLIGKCMYI